MFFQKRWCHCYDFAACGFSSQESFYRCTEVYVLPKTPRNSTYNKLCALELGKSLGASYLSFLHVGSNAHYTSEHCMQELLQCLGETG